MKNRKIFQSGISPKVDMNPSEESVISNHAKLSVIHLGLLSLSLQQHTQEEFRMDRNKNQQQNQILKSSYLWCIHTTLLVQTVEWQGGEREAAWCLYPRSRGTGTR